jgi:hypothetical protein
MNTKMLGDILSGNIAEYKNIDFRVREINYERFPEQMKGYAEIILIFDVPANIQEIPDSLISPGDVCIGLTPEGLDEDDEEDIRKIYRLFVFSKLDEDPSVNNVPVYKETEDDEQKTS